MKFGKQVLFGLMFILCLTEPQCINTNDDIRIDAPTGLTVKAVYYSGFQLNSLAWDCCGPYMTQVWRMIDNGTYTIVGDSIKKCQYVDSGNAKLNLAIYTIRYLIPGDKYSVFCQPVGLLGIPGQTNDPNNGTFGPDGFSVQCH